MSGRVSVSRVAARYWARVPEDDRRAIEASVPDGMTLVLYPGHQAKPGTTTVSLRDAENRAVVPDERGRALAQMCRSILWRASRSVA